MISLSLASAARASRPLAVRPLSYRLFSTSPVRAGSKLNKVLSSADAAVKDIKAGSVIVAGGFGLCGSANTLISALAKYPEKNNLTIVSNNSGVGKEGVGMCPGSVPWGIVCVCVCRH